jgi:anaerobic carbon-monoxide dehydrogenase iron sulfur subunit
VTYCTIAHSQSGDLYEAILEDPPPRPRVHLNQVGSVTVPIACRQCEAAACMMVCPTGAVSRANSDDPVVLDNDLCVGCRSCVVVCPYGVPEMNQNRDGVIKCDLCIERLDVGQVPACVEACHPGALTFVEYSDELDETPPWVKKAERLSKGGA